MKTYQIFCPGQPSEQSIRISSAWANWKRSSNFLVSFLDPTKLVQDRISKIRYVISIEPNPIKIGGISHGNQQHDILTNFSMSGSSLWQKMGTMLKINFLLGQKRQELMIFWKRRRTHFRHHVELIRVECFTSGNGCSPSLLASSNFQKR